MKIKSSFVLFMSTFVLVALLLGCMSNTTRGVTEIERNGIKLLIPNQYMYHSSLSWINEVRGLDTNVNSFLIKIPKDEIKQLLPSDTPSGQLEPTDLIVLVYLPSINEKKLMLKNKQESFDQIVQRTQYFSEAYEVLDTNLLLYKVYQSSKLKSRWYVLLSPPYSGEPLTDINDLLGLCQENEDIGKQCDLSLLVFNDVAIEISLRYEHLVFYEKISEYVFALINSWRQ